MNILVLVRNKPIRDQIVVGLQNFPEFAVEIAEGFSGLNRTHQKDFDTVIIGCTEEEPEGLQLVERFRGYDEKTELVVVAEAKRAKVLVSQRSRFDITSVLQEPLDPEDFFRVVAQAPPQRRGASRSQLTRRKARRGEASFAPGCCRDTPRRCPTLHAATGTQPRTRLFLEGRYRKLVRGLPQTIFYCPRCKGRGCRNCGRFGKLTKDSVQELIARKVLGWFRAKQGQVPRRRTRGPGCPDARAGPALRLRSSVAPKRDDVELDELREAINRYAEGRVAVTQLVPVPRAARRPDQGDPFAQGLRRARRARRRCRHASDTALAESRPPPSRGSALEVTQRTPQRVAHRRADKDRCTREVEITVGPLREQGTAARRHRLSARHLCQGVGQRRGRPEPTESGGSPHAVRRSCVALDVLEVLGPFPAARGAEGDGRVGRHPRSKPSPCPSRSRQSSSRTIPWGLLPENREPEPMSGRLAEEKEQPVPSPGSQAESAPQEEEAGRPARRRRSAAIAVGPSAAGRSSRRSGSGIAAAGSAATGRPSASSASRYSQGLRVERDLGCGPEQVEERAMAAIPSGRPLSVRRRSETSAPSFAGQAAASSCRTRRRPSPAADRPARTPRSPTRIGSESSSSRWIAAASSTSGPSK